MKCLPLLFLVLGLASGTELDDFVAASKERHGDAGERAAEFLVEHMPAKDKESLTADFLAENLDLAFRARAEFPWAKQVPEEVFLNDVLPYAVFNETREAWRKDYLELARPIVKGAKSASEAAQALNREFFNTIDVHYNTGRKRPNQSPAESKKLGMATCTGLSIILVDACRAVGIPARAVGTPLWANERGNHTWVEIWDGGWHFTGADEYDEKGLNRGWFVDDAAQAKRDVPKHAIYATSWKKDGLAFPMVWSPRSREVAAVNVTERYVEVPVILKPGLAIRFLEGNAKDARKVVTGWLTTVAGRKLEEFETKAGTADLNDRARVAITPGENYRIRLELESGPYETKPFPGEEGEKERDLTMADLEAVPEVILELSAGRDPRGSLTREEAMRAAELQFEVMTEGQRDVRAGELNDQSIQLGDKNLRWLEKTFGEAPEDGRSLWISMHGGGGAPPRVNDQQWRNQIRLYEPEEGIYVAPRAPTDTWNLWHESHIDPMFQRLIENYVAVRGVNPDKVYLMGYSAGGDGVWQLAPRMADRFAAAAMMAGHPNEASLLGLRNLPFAIFMGGADAAYERNKVAAAKTAELARLEKDDPGGYVHMSRIYEGVPHWMDGKDVEALPWMAKFTRDPWPEKIVWLQDDVTHDRFYWLKIPDKAAAKAGQKIVATADGQTIRLEGDVPAGMELRLSDELLDLDQPVTVMVNGKQVVSAKVPRTTGAIVETLGERLDLPAAATAILVLPGA